MKMTSRGILKLSAVLCVAGYVWVYGSGRADLPIRSDGFSYYVYLPSWFLFGDPTLAAVARDCCGGEFPEYTAIVRWPGTPRWGNAHPIGVAVMQAPFFPVAHGLTKWTNLSPDGFTLYYQHAAGLAGLAWAVAGLAVLRRLLLRFFSDRVTAVTLVAVLFGTNLFHYATFDSTYSHAYSFFLFAVLMDLTVRWHERRDARTSVLIGIVIGMIGLVRHTNIIFGTVFLFYGLGTDLGVSGIFKRLAGARGELARIAAVALVVIAPQLLIYYLATGTVVVNSYGGLGFDWTSPRIGAVLFGVRKGLFFWSPLLLIGAAGLVLVARSRHRGSGLVIPGVAILAVHTYLIASWWDWQFGGSYGHRGFVDVLPLFAVGLAGVLDRAGRTRPTRLAAAMVLAPLISLSTFQMLQYWYGIVPFNDTTWTQYRELFLQWR